MVVYKISYIFVPYKQRNKIMTNLIAKIEKLEAKSDNGTITMEEEVILMKLTDLAINFLTKK